MDNSLSPMQLRFIEEYLQSNNGKQAAIKAGYSENTAEQQASRLLRNVKVQEELKARRMALIEELNNQFISDALTARKVLIEVMNDKNASENARINAAKDLLDRAGFKPTDKKEIYGKDGGAIEIVFTSPE